MQKKLLLPPGSENGATSFDHIKKILEENQSILQSHHCVKDRKIIIQPIGSWHENCRKNFFKLIKSFRHQQDGNKIIIFPKC
jgi:hypothetical protein